MARHAARLLAPLALAAVAVGVYLIVDNNTGSSHKSSVTHSGSRSAVTRHRGRRPPAKPTYYTVQSGDTLSAIVQRTGVALDRLTALNPTLQPPYALSTGQRLRLRR